MAASCSTSLQGGTPREGARELPLSPSSLLLMYSRLRALHSQMKPTQEDISPGQPPPATLSRPPCATLPTTISANLSPVEFQPAPLAMVSDIGWGFLAEQGVPPLDHLGFSDSLSDSVPHGDPAGTPFPSDPMLLGFRQQRFMATPVLEGEELWSAPLHHNTCHYQHDSALYYAAPHQAPTGASCMPGPLPQYPFAGTHCLSGAAQETNIVPHCTSSGVPELKTPQQVPGSLLSPLGSGTESCESPCVGGSFVRNGASGCGVSYLHPGKREREDSAEEEDEKAEGHVERKLRRLLSNRASAKRSRQRKQDRLQELEVLSAKLRVEQTEMQRQLVEARCQLSKAEAENQELRDKIRSCKVKESGGSKEPERPKLQSSSEKESTLGQEDTPLGDEAVAASAVRTENEGRGEHEEDAEGDNQLEHDYLAAGLVNGAGCFDNEHVFHLP